MQAGCVSDHLEGTVLRVRVTPNAARTEASGVLDEGEGGERIQVRLKAPPVEGKANAAVCAWAAGVFGVRSSKVSVLRGEKSRVKDLLLAGVEVQEARRAIASLFESIQETEEKEERDV